MNNSPKIVRPKQSPLKTEYASRRSVTDGSTVEPEDIAVNRQAARDDAAIERASVKAQATSL